MSTREKILQTALELYNNQGVSAVTSRHIAAEMGISGGNLHYHFKHTDEIIITLYGTLANEISACISVVEREAIQGITAFRTFIDTFFELTYRYRFVFLHAVEISLRIPSLGKDYRALIKRRTQEFLAIFSSFVKQGIFLADLPAKVWNVLVAQCFIVMDFWLSNNELTLQLKGKKAVAYYSDQFFIMFYPYMTKKARKELGM